MEQTRISEYKAGLIELQDGKEFDQSCASLVRKNKNDKWILTREGREMAARVALRALPDNFDGNLEEARQYTEDRLAELRESLAKSQMTEEQAAFWRSTERSIRVRERKAERLVTLDRIAARGTELGGAVDSAVRRLGSERQVINEMVNYNTDLEHQIRIIGVSSIRSNQIKEECDSHLGQCIDFYLTATDLSSTALKKEARQGFVYKAISQHDYKTDDPEQLIAGLVDTANKRQEEKDRYYWENITNSVWDAENRKKPVVIEMPEEESQWQKLSQKLKGVFKLSPEQIWNIEVAGAAGLLIFAYIYLEQQGVFNKIKENLDNLFNKQRYSELVTAQNTISTLAPTTTGTATLEVKPTGTPIPITPTATLTPEPTGTSTPVPTREAFVIENEQNAKWDLKSDFTMEFSTGLALAGGKDKVMPWYAVSQPALTVQKALDMMKMFGTTAENNQRKQDGKKPLWMEDPNPAGIINSTNPDRPMVFCHDGGADIKPSDMNQDWLAEWKQFNPNGNPDTVQRVDLPCQVFFQAGKAAEGKLIRVKNKNGDWIVMQIVDVRKVSVQDLYNASGSPDASNPDAPVDFDLQYLGVPQWNEEGPTFVTCADYDPASKEFKSRELISAVPVTNIDLGVFADQAKNNPTIKNDIELANTVLDYQFTDGSQLMGDFLMNSDWFKKKPKAEQDKLKPILLTLVNSGTHNFAFNTEMGLQCIGLAGIEIGDAKNPVFIGGEDVVGPAGVVPPEIKAAANSPTLISMESGKREWWTGKVNISDLEAGDQIMLWNTGAVTTDGKDVGHVVVVIGTLTDKNGVHHVLTIEANHSPESAGQIIIRDMSEANGKTLQEQESIGIYSAVLLVNKNTGKKG